MTFGPTPLDIAEFEIELLAFSTNPDIIYLSDCLALSRVRRRGSVLEFPPAWCAAKPSLRKRARDKWKRQEDDLEEIEDVEEIGEDTCRSA